MNSMARSRSYDSNFWISLLNGIVLLIFGVILLKSPIESIRSLSVIFGIVIILIGTLELLFAYNVRKAKLKWGWAFTSGIFDLLLGAFIVANPGFLLDLVTTVISIWLVVSGINSIVVAIRVKNIDPVAYKQRLIFGIVLIAIAILFIWHPEIIGITMAFWAALAFIFVGIMRITLAFKPAA